MVAYKKYRTRKNRTRRGKKGHRKTSRRTSKKMDFFGLFKM